MQDAIFDVSGPVHCQFQFPPRDRIRRTIRSRRTVFRQRASAAITLIRKHEMLPPV
jgi:hypothetical protein